MYFNVYSIPVFIAGLIMLSLVAMTYRYRNNPGMKSFLLLMLAGAVYSIFYAFEILSVNLHLVATFYKLEYLGIPFIPAFYLLFAIRYSGKQETLNISAITAIMAIPVTTILLVFTNSGHQLFISNGHLDEQGLFTTYAFTPGVGYWLHQTYTIFTIAVSFVLFLKMWLNSAPAFRKQISTILVASFVPFIVYIVYLLNAFPFGLDPVPFAFALTGLIIYSGLTYFKLFNLAPLARKLLFEKIPNAVIVFDDHMRMVDCNQAATDLLKINPSQMGEPAKEALKDWPQIIYYIYQSTATGEPDILDIGSNGNKLFLEPLCSALLDKDHKVRGKMLILHDVTQQRKSEIKRREIEEKFRLIFESAPLGVVYFDEGGVIRVCNDVFVSIIGSSREKLIGLNCLNLPDNQVVKALTDALNGKTGYFEGDYHSYTANKSTQLKALFQGIYTEDGRLQGGFGIIEDITERKEAEIKIRKKNEELQKLNAEKDRFFSIIAHDLRGPFSAFLGYTELMIDETENLSTDELRSFAIQIRKSALSLFALLENLLEWSRLQQQSFTMQPENLNPHQLAINCMHILEENAKKKELSIHNNIPVKLQAYGDEKMISSVLRNLISNAIKFTHRYGKISIDASDTTNNSIEISVRDNGIGIEKSNVDKLFRIDQKTGLPGTEDEPSTGLGLILCREFVEKHKGRIWVESEPGIGSDFHFTLPANKESYSLNNSKP